MPELPEVETVRKQIELELVGETVGGVEVRERMVFLGDEKDMQGEKIVGASRVGKYLFVHFGSGRGLGIHLKMTGRLVIDKPKKQIDIETKKQSIKVSENQSVKLSNNQRIRVTKGQIDNEVNSDVKYESAPHTRVAIHLSSGRKLYYWDTRKFGFIKIVSDIRQAVDKTKDALGPEPWDIDEVSLLRKLQKTGRTIKDVLLDQSILAGVGNIYANDALWLAGILPSRKAKSIGLKEAKKLLEAIRSVMERGLATGGASDNTYRDLYGGRGGYQNEFLVYGKTKEPCPKCGKELIYTKIGGRGSWYCENDQK